MAVLAQETFNLIVKRSLPHSVFAGLVLGALLGLLFIAATSLEALSRALWMFLIVSSVIGLVAVVSIGCILLPYYARFRQRFPDVAVRLRHAGSFFGVILLASIVIVALYHLAFEPLKFQYLIRRVESAQTSQEERSAFDLAARWGHVWELNRLTNREWLPERAQHLQGAWILKLEWLEGSLWTGEPFRAYRVVLDEKNLEIMDRKKGTK